MVKVCKINYLPRFDYHSQADVVYAVGAVAKELWPWVDWCRERRREWVQPRHTDRLMRFFNARDSCDWLELSCLRFSIDSMLELLMWWAAHLHDVWHGGVSGAALITRGRAIKPAN